MQRTEPSPVSRPTRRRKRDAGTGGTAFPTYLQPGLFTTWAPRSLERWIDDAPYHSAAHVATADDKVIVIDGPGEYEASGIRIKGIRTSRYIPDGPPARNTVYTFETEGIVVCHLGDPDRLLTAREIEELGSPHVLILPVGSRNGLSAADAVELVNAIAPRIIVPVMFAHPGNRVELREIGPFLQELGAKQPEQVSRLTMTRATLPEEAQVSMLQPAAGLI